MHDPKVSIFPCESVTWELMHLILFLLKENRGRGGERVCQENNTPLQENNTSIDRYIIIIINNNIYNTLSFDISRVYVRLFNAYLKSKNKY